MVVALSSRCWRHRQREASTGVLPLRPLGVGCAYITSGEEVRYEPSAAGQSEDGSTQPVLLIRRDEYFPICVVERSSVEGAVEDKCCVAVDLYLDHIRVVSRRDPVAPLGISLS